MPKTETSIKGNKSKREKGLHKKGGNCLRSQLVFCLKIFKLSQIRVGYFQFQKHSFLSLIDFINNPQSFNTQLDRQSNKVFLNSPLPFSLTKHICIYYSWCKTTAFERGRCARGLYMYLFGWKINNSVSLDSTTKCIIAAILYLCWELQRDEKFRRLFDNIS